MNKRQVMNVVKKMTAGMLATGMILAGVGVCPQKADAAVTVPSEIIYETTSLDTVKTYWNSTGKTAPVKEGYVFGGWYKADNNNADSCLTENELDSNNDGTADYTGNIYAKYVPAQVLSVKAQNESIVTEDFITNFTNGTDKFYVRVISSLDSTNYAKVGFDIYLANSVKVTAENGAALETTKVYSGLKEGNSSKSAQDVFGGVSRYLSVWQLSQIDQKANVEKIIYVRPYWITKDGTKVNGLAKYVHIEDQYKGYTSIPVNVASAEKIAGGLVNVTYDNEGLEIVGFEAGRILPEMQYNHDATNKTLKMVGNAATVGSYNADETIFANIRVKRPTTDTSCEVQAVEFCDWDEKTVAADKVTTWDLTLK